MANDIDLWNDIEEETTPKEMKADMLGCFIARHIEGDLNKANKLKNCFAEK